MASVCSSTGLAQAGFVSPTLSKKDGIWASRPSSSPLARWRSTALAR